MTKFRMSKKVLKNRYTHQEKPLSVVEPLQFKSFSCPPSKELGKRAVISSNYRLKHGELGSEKAQWEYEPWGSTNSSAVEHHLDNKVSLPNGQPSCQPRKKAALACFSSSMSFSLQLEKKSSFLCDSSDSNTSDSQTWFLNSMSSSSFDPKSEQALNFKHHSSGTPPVKLPSFSSCESQNNLSNQQNYEDIPKTNVFPSANCASSSTATVKSIEDSESSSDTISKKNYELSNSESNSKDESNESQRGKNPPVHRKRKVDNLLPKGCKFSKSEIVDAPIDTFNKLVEKLPKDEQMSYKDSRRKGKNRGAARRARDRRILQQNELLIKKETVSKEVQSMEEELKALVEESKFWVQILDFIKCRVNHLKSKL